MLRLIKAVIRIELVEEVAAALKVAGVPRLTVNHVRAVGSAVDPTKEKLSLELGTGYTEKALVQFVCAEHRVDALIAVIREHARTGRRGDGVIFITPVDRAIKIRTGAEGTEAVA